MYNDPYRPPSFFRTSYVVKNLIIINALMYFATMVLATKDINLIKYLALYNPHSKLFHPYQFVTHMFMHGGFGHIFFNMFGLWMFGANIERMWGPKRFLFYYMVTGLGAAFVHTMVNYNQPFQMIDQYGAVHDIPTVGASGAIYGVLLAFGMLFPNVIIYFNFLFPIKAKYFVLIFGAIELFSGFRSAGDNVAHFAHLGGMIFGFILIQYWRRNPPHF